MRIHISHMNLYSHTSPESIISQFTVVGINYRHADVTTRSLFSVSSSNCHTILEEAKEKGIKSLFILSTCNRTEIYAYCTDTAFLEDVLIRHTNGSKMLFENGGFIKKGLSSLSHLFSVAAGLDSQITGDYEIQSQLKNAISLSRKFKMIGPVMDRTVSFVLQASKSVRTNTELSKGTVSVSYAVIEWLQKAGDPKGKKIVLIGAGALGTALAKNLCHYLPGNDVTILNRTDEIAEQLAVSLSLNWKPYPELTTEVNTADIIITATNAPGYLLRPHFFSTSKSRTIIDLAVPSNVDPAVGNIPGHTLHAIDEISQVMETTLAKRNNEIPKALSILDAYQAEFLNWLHLQKHIPMINAMKDKLQMLGKIHFCNSEGKQLLSSRVNKTVGSLAMNLRYRHEKGCHYINAINEFLQPGSYE